MDQSLLTNSAELPVRMLGQFTCHLHSRFRFPQTLTSLSSISVAVLGLDFFSHSGSVSTAAHPHE